MLPSPTNLLLTFGILLSITLAFYFKDMPLTITFCVAVGLLVWLLTEAWVKRRQYQWALPAALIYVTTIAWYFVDPFIHPDAYDFIPEFLINLGYLQVIIFLLGFRLLVPRVTRYICSGSAQIFARQKNVPIEALFWVLVTSWAVLFVIGFVTMTEDATVFDALFPLDSRAEGSKLLWLRGSGAESGPFAFLISSGGYLYSLVCALLGVTVLFLRSPAARIFNVVLLALIWPYFLLGGTRSAFVAVILPLATAYMLFGRQWMSTKLTVAGAAFLVVNSLLLVVGLYRGTGFRALLAGDSQEEFTSEDMTHNGLNMIQELCFVDVYYLSGACQLSYGKDYLAEGLNVVPRAIWSSKPYLGIEYSKWRGFAGGTAEIGVVATVSTGFIGGGIVNFGPYFGPLAPAFLMCVWVGLLTRWWLQRASLLRACLFLAGMGLTFNLGRDITLLVLWPIVFGYVAVRGIEVLTRSPQTALRPRIHRSAGGPGRILVPGTP